MDLAGRLDSTIASAIANGKITGAVTIVAREGEIVYRKAQGHADREAGRMMQPDAIFRLASVTKPLVAATALAMIERGLIELENSVADHLPWSRPKLADGSEPRLTIRHLITHTSGLGYAYAADPVITTGIADTNLSLEENFSRVARLPLSFPPGEGWQYGVSIDVLGAVIAQIHGGELADALHHYITGPLGMTDTAFAITDTARLAVPYADGTPPIRMADPQSVTDASGVATVFSPSRAFNRKAFQSGGAGAVGTADDIMKFLEALRTGGEPILLRDSVAQGFMNQVGDLPRRPGDEGQRFGFFGAVIDDPAAAKRPQARGTIRWGGVYGHDWSIDPQNALTVLSMTNTALEGCTGQYPRDILRAVYDH